MPDAHFVAMRPLALANGPVRRGERVDVSGWPGRVIAAHVRTHALAVRVGDRVGVPTPRARVCGECGLPFASVSAMTDHGRLDHGHPGEPGTVPDVAVRWVTVTATAGQRAQLDAGTCPICGLPGADSAHVASAHPEVEGLTRAAA